MRDSRRQEQVPLECYLNGDFELLPFERARELVWTFDFAWVLRLGWRRYGWAGHADAGDTRPLAEASGEQFGFALLTQVAPLTLAQFEKRIGAADAIGVDVFQARAARFNRLIAEALRKTAPLYEWWPMIGLYGRPEPAYRVVSNRTTIVVAGVDSDGGADDALVPWHLLKRPLNDARAQAV